MKNILNKIKTIKAFFSGITPGQVIIQYTDRCNATCPQCDMRINLTTKKRHKLKPEIIKKIIDTSAEKNIKAISFTGGEPFLYFEELLEAIKYAEEKGIEYIRTGTNGFLFKEYWDKNFEKNIEEIASKMADTKLRNFWISIDSYVPELHEKMRGLKGVIAGIEKALPIFHKYGIYPSANLGINKNIGGVRKTDDKEISDFRTNFAKQMETFFEYTIKMGFTMVNLCYPMSFDNESKLDAIYGAGSESAIVKFSNEEKAMIFSALLEVIPKYRKKIKIFTPMSSIYALYNQYTGKADFPAQCRGGEEYYFVDSEKGDTFPCGYRGSENMGKIWEMEKKADKSRCIKCEWECFRDPSELFFPITGIFQDSKMWFRKFIMDSKYRGYWISDMLYYKKSDYFNGRGKAE